MNNNGIIGKNMASLRREAHHTQEEVARVLGVTEPMVSSYERGGIKLPLVVAYKLAGMFGCDVMDFLKGVELDEGQAGNA